MGHLAPVEPVHPRLLAILRTRPFSAGDLEAACREALAIVGDEPRVSARQKIAVALTAVPGGTALDVGGGVSLIPLVTQLMGTSVTVVDAFYDWPFDVARRRERLARHGVTFIEADLTEGSDLPRATFDRAVAFETIEHLPHSPRPALEAMVDTLKPGGRLCLSTPNVARIDMRLRVLKGRSPHEGIAHFYREGTPFTGHHREYTVDEFRFLADALALVDANVFTVNVTYESRKRQSAVKRLLLSLDEHGLGDRLLPPRLRHHVWLDAAKA